LSFFRVLFRVASNKLYPRGYPSPVIPPPAIGGTHRHIVLEGAQKKGEPMRGSTASRVFRVVDWNARENVIIHIPTLINIIRVHHRAITVAKAQSASPFLRRHPSGTYIIIIIAERAFHHRTARGGKSVITPPFLSTLPSCMYPPCLSNYMTKKMKLSHRRTTTSCCFSREERRIQRPTQRTLKGTSHFCNIL
jgi:hypothetical protein